ncbi:hypothetical protein [Vibrio penaeicida]|uniref:Uncharacterized protein n=2 Tax=Vibrio penaeicida TaxID=104609 RepID=A0AAV5NMA1_9VIBR|nr:hypothetical protein [Vibrio penaeicida]MDP2571153.1 hypothetical protein [Vibrio penaeicida]GLQ71479.1 hypothetical protein GCM10007932_08390 [Vibrio penaeicida]
MLGSESPQLASINSMRTIICNSAQSFWDMADNQFLDGREVHCVFPVNDSMKRYIMSYQNRCNIRNISFSEVFSTKIDENSSVKDVFKFLALAEV